MIEADFHASYIIDIELSDHDARAYASHLGIYSVELEHSVGYYDAAIFAPQSLAYSITTPRDTDLALLYWNATHIIDNVRRDRSFLWGHGVRYLTQYPADEEVALQCAGVFLIEDEDTFVSPSAEDL